MSIKPNSIDDLVCTTFSDGDIWENGPYSQLTDNARPRREWRWQGALHSIDDHPAIIFSDNGEQQWYAHGTRHRPEHLGPAWIKTSPSLQLYYAAGELHRRGGPAMIYPSSEKWYQCNVLHRADGPAIVRTSRWGLVHIDPPAIEWWFNGSRFKDVDEWGKFNPIDPEVFTLLKLEYG
jgi:hypothetical protein